MINKKGEGQQEGEGPSHDSQLLRMNNESRLLVSAFHKGYLYNSSLLSKQTLREVFNWNLKKRMGLFKCHDSQKCSDFSRMPHDLIYFAIVTLCEIDRKSRQP